jgi:apolipoprotein N-acyltransferase
MVRQNLISLLWVASAAIATGTMLILALPLGEQAWLAWFMLVPLLAATKTKGFLIGFVSALGAVFWCAYVSTTGVFYRAHDFDPQPGWTYSGCGLFGFCFAIFFAIWADARNHEKPIWWFAALAVSLESILLLILPAPLAITQYRNPIMMFVASAVGIWGVSYLVWITNLAFVKSRFGQILAVTLAVASAALTHRYHPGNGSPTISVAAAQFKDGSDKELTDAHTSISSRSVVFDVWPEFAGMMFVTGNDTSKLKDLSINSVPIITSFRDNNTPLPHNVAAVFDRGKESARYEKRKLFGSETKMHESGTRPVAVPVGEPSITIGLNICYDSCFPYIIRETASLPEVKIVALPTIDPDSTHYFIAGMHAAFTPFRAAENGIAMVRADGHFGSMIVDEHGHIIAEVGAEQATLKGSVSGQRAWTIYQVIGDFFWFLCVAVTFSFPILVVSKTAKARRGRAIEAARKAR